MNKSLLMAITACAAMAMTSCSSEDLTSGTTQANETPISFSTYLGRAAESRATVVSGGVEKFGVFAFYTGQDTWDNYASKTTPNFMNNQEVTGTSTTENTTTTWTYEYSPLKYWPNNADDKISFFAYAPYQSGTQFAEDGTGSSKDYKVSFTVDNNVKNQIDRLYAIALTDKTKQNIGDKVKFEFKHALSRIGFQVAYAADGTTQGNTKIDGKTKMTLSKVVLHKAGGSVTEGVFYKSGAMSLYKNTVTTTKAGNQVQTVTLDKNNFVGGNDFTVTNEYQQLNANDSYIMVIPIDLSASDGGFDVTVTYTVTTEDSNLPEEKSEITNTITNTAHVSFEQGKAYTLKLLLGMTSVKIDAASTTWDSEETTVNLPANTTTASN